MCVINKSCLILLFLSLYLPIHAQWKQKEFIIGTFYDPKLPDKNINDTTAYFDKLKTAKECYFNFLSGLDSYYDYNFISTKLSHLSKLGMKTLVLNESTVSGIYDTEKGNKLIDFTRNFDSTQRNSFYGYFLFDEPVPSKFDNLQKWIVFLKKRDPNKLVYVNFLPSYLFKDSADYNNYVAPLLNKKDFLHTLDVASYDFYPFTVTGFRKDYFFNLSFIKKKAGERPFWCYALTTKHNNYSEPDDYKLNFMAFAPEIYGAKGILYFTYETIVRSKIPFGPAIIDSNNNPTSKYYHIQKINRFLKDVIGPIIMTSENLGVYHTSNQLYNEELEKENQITNKTLLISNIQNPFMAAGVFKSNQNKNEYNLLLMNKSPNAQKGVTVVLKGNFTNNMSLSVPFTQYSSPKKTFENIPATYNQTTNKTTCKIDFEPGEERVLKVIAAP